MTQQLTAEELIQYPIYLRKTLQVLCMLGRATAQDVANHTRVARAYQSFLLNRLTELKTVRKERVKRLTYFFISPTKARFMGLGTLVQGNVEIGKGTWVGYYCIFEALNEGTKVTIGENCSIANFVRIYTHDTSYRTVRPDVYKKRTGSVTVGNYTQIGEGTIIMHGAKIGDHCIIGAGSVVLRDTVFPPCTLAAGNPCKIIKSVRI